MNRRLFDHLEKYVFFLKSQFPADLVIFTEETLNGKLYLCSVSTVDCVGIILFISM